MGEWWHVPALNATASVVTFLPRLAGPRSKCKPIYQQAFMALTSQRHIHCPVCVYVQLIRSLNDSLCMLNHSYCDWLTDWVNWLIDWLNHSHNQSINYLAIHSFSHVTYSTQQEVVIITPCPVTTVLFITLLSNRDTSSYFCEHV